MKRPPEQTNPWHTLATQRLLQTPWLTMRQDRVLTHTSQEITYTFLEQPGSVVIVPVTANKEVVLLRQYRYPVGEWCWEVPAGKMEEQDSMLAAQRELREEIGGTYQHFFYISTFYPSNGISNGQCHLYLAIGVTLGESQQEDTELLHVVTMPYAEAMQLVQEGAVTDGISALALLLCQSRLDQR